MEETLPDVSNNEPNGGDYRGYIEVKPWTRFWARTLDYIIFVSLTFLLAETLFNMQLKWFYSFLLYFLAVFIWNPIEAALLSTWGTTPGKWLFNVTLRVDEVKKLKFMPALERSISVWFFGIGMGIPLVCIPGMIMQYKKLLGMKATSWDNKKKFTVNHGYLRGFKTTIAVLIYAVFVIIQIIVPQMKSGVKLSAKLIKQYGVFESAASTDENDGIEYSNYANALYVLGNVSEAEKAYDKSLEVKRVSG